MKKFLLSLILLIAFSLRFHQYWIVPLSDETADEMAWTWLGASLLQEGTPASWSLFPAYENGYVYKTGVVEAPIVRPALDHPPLFAIIPGLVQTLDGRLFEIPSSKVIRLPMVLLGVFNVWLLYLVSKQFFSEKWSLMAAGIYATVPLFVLSSRLVVAENLIITWYLLFIFVFFKWMQKSGRKWRNLLVVLSVAAVMTKISGIVVPLSLVAYGLLEKKQEIWKLGIVSTLISLGVLLAYGGLYNLPLFLEVQLSQGGRDLGLATLFYRFLIHPTVAKFIFIDGWQLLGLISFIFLIFTKNVFESKTEGGWKMIQVLGLLSLAFILFTSGQFTFHGWYSYPLFPIFILSTVNLFEQKIFKNALIGSFIWLLLLPIVELVFQQNGLKPSVNFVRAMYLLSLLPAITQLWGNKKWLRASYVFLVVIMLVFNIVYILTANETSVRANHDLFFYNLNQ